MTTAAGSRFQHKSIGLSADFSDFFKTTLLPLRHNYSHWIILYSIGRIALFCKKLWLFIALDTKIIICSIHDVVTGVEESNSKQSRSLS